MVLKLFKTACLSYQASDVNYREHKLTRNQLLGMRKDLIDKVNEYMQNSGLHKEGSVYPRRYFDDLIMEQHLRSATGHHESKILAQSVTEDKLRDLISPRVPFGVPTGKSTSRHFIQNFLSKSIEVSSPRISQDETGLDSNRTSSFVKKSKVRGMGVA